MVPRESDSRGMRRFIERSKRHQGHQRHLCRLVSERRMSEVAELARGAKYMCQTCGRGAAEAKNLCDPVHLAKRVDLVSHDDSTHHQHLCQLVEKREMRRVAELAKDAQYFCGWCGRAAANADNLCDPIHREGPYV
jgi:rubrerythrin